LKAGPFNNPTMAERIHQPVFDAFVFEHPGGHCGRDY
jgi:hypothetical protein